MTRRPDSGRDATSAGGGNQPPFDGDADWRIVHSLPDGRPITIRPIFAEDREELRRALATLSARTRLLRFGTLRVPDDDMLSYLTDVDQRDHVALVATLTSPDLKVERGIGVARFIRLAREPLVAEAAVTVVDDMQGQGVGTLLTRELERAARARGVRVLRAEVLPENATMIAILEGAGARRAPSEGGNIGFEIDLSDEPPVSRRLGDVLRGAAAHGRSPGS